MSGESDVLNIREAAAHLGAHAQTVRKLARAGKLPAFKVGKDWRFRREALERWAEQQQPGRRSTSVLVVDDEPGVRAALCRIVERIGCVTRQAEDGVVGLALVAEQVPDVILLDLVMPVMNGPQFLAQLRKTQPGLPVVIVTGHPDGELMQQASLHAPVMLLSKPVDPRLLERTVQAVRGNHVSATAGKQPP